ncbi:MAG TPA: tRNA pseudouridine(55) synthase TruB [Alphaproteobacteria bacterium]|nr:tRNA pseudouridine(55) synthase TruB [Alphaproteobacteria bacterium]
MAARRKGQPIHGWIVLDKPRGITSAQAVARVRRALDAAKAGHGGTLDPLATGVLPIALGEATKTVAFEMDGSKSYRFTLRWGEARATDDAEGAVTETSPNRPSEAEVRAVLPRFIGEILQVPPKFSAIKVAGERAYALARAEQAFELAPRPIVIERLTLGRSDRDTATFEVVCGKGAYMRALARDIALALGTRAHIVDLRRLSAGPFTESQAISLDSLEALGHSAAALASLLPIETALDGIPALALSEGEARVLRSGQSVPLLRAQDVDRIGSLVPGIAVCAMANGKPVAVARFDRGRLRPVRVFNL